MDTRPVPRTVRFGAFELDLRSGELRKRGAKVGLQGQPFEILALLAQHPGEVITREELRSKLWPADTFVDFEDGLNTAVRKIRAALGDSPEKPQFIETLPRRGYRFVAPLEGSTAAALQRKESSAQPTATLSRANGRGAISSIAVLPLINLSGDPAQEYFADGMTEALTTDLAQIRELRVISRTSAMQYKHAQKTMPEIARDLNVEGVIEGAVSRSQNRVRVTAQLIHAPSDRHLWAKNYERELQDVLTLQSELALAIATEVQIHLTSAEKERLSSPHALKSEALEAFLRGRYFWSRRTEEALNRAIEYFNQAIREGPGYAPAYAGLSDCYSALAWNSMRAPHDTLPKAKAAALTALKLDDQLADAHFSLGVVLMFHDWNWAQADLEFKRCIQLNPSYSHARPWYAFMLSALGRHVEALAECERALRIDPLMLPIMLGFAVVLYLARDYDRSVAMCQKMLEMDPASFYQAHWFLAAAYERKGMLEEAIASWEKAVTISNRNAHMVGNLGHTLGRSGKSGEAWKVLHSLQQRSEREYIAPFNLAIVFLGLGEKEKTLEWLERAYEDRSIWMLFLNTYPIFDDLRSEPRFQALVRRMGFESGALNTAACRAE